MRVSGPLFSKTASGSVVDVLTFSKRKSGQQVRFQRKQSYLASVEQLTQRSKFSAASVACRFFEFGELQFGACLFGNEAELYVGANGVRPLTSYNQCILENIFLF